MPWPPTSCGARSAAAPPPTTSAWSRRGWAPTASRPSSPPTSRGCGRSASTRGATRWATWRNAVTKKLDAGQSAEELANDLETGARLLQRVGRRPAERPNRDLLFGAANALRDTALPLHARVAPGAVPGRARDHDRATRSAS